MRKGEAFPHIRRHSRNCLGRSKKNISSPARHAAGNNPLISRTTRFTSS
jgi:hypothetical protein